MFFLKHVLKIIDDDCNKKKRFLKLREVIQKVLKHFYQVLKTFNKI